MDNKDSLVEKISFAASHLLRFLFIRSNKSEKGIIKKKEHLIAAVFDCDRSK